ncbi:ExbD/TolR family protein [Calothrix sp. PCC 6303]|uniref:ExbD/TolR family protein n=1 Tax=Calothrix sp. PCC 6303 TaxID=1170562 RepID=UPI0002A05269|nr:biopolymer transporter ExbD [Calothrix sp. PCC 6303]AFZ04470.1 Biopolymer transport protein ExbD/TolR [Calothrix sp. PCC 6303]
MKISSQTTSEDAQVQIIPLIDVIFCILTFFILAALQFSRKEAIKAINLDLPKASTATTSPALPGDTNKTDPQRLIIHIDPINQLYVIEPQGQRLITREQLPGVLGNYLKQNPSGTLLLNAARSAQYNDVIETLNVLRQVGGDRVSLGVIQNASVTEEPTTTTAPPAPLFPASPGSAPQLGNPQPAIPNFPPTTNTQPGQNVNPQYVPNSGVAPVQPGVPVPSSPSSP